MPLLQTWRDRSRGRRLLARMSTRELHDIGISEAERRFEMGAPCWREIRAAAERDRAQRLRQFCAGRQLWKCCSTR